MKIIIKLIKLIIPPYTRDKIRFSFKKLKILFKLLILDLKILQNNKDSDFSKYVTNSKTLDSLYLYNKYFGSFLNICLIRKLKINFDFNNIDRLNLKSKISILFEKGKFDELSNLIKNKNNKNIDLKKFNLFNIFINRNDLDNENTKDILDQNFYKLINNKSIAIVGPGNNLIKNGREIENFDLIVRTNFTSGKILDKELVGLRTDISYYNDAYWIDNKSSILKTNKKIFKIFKTRKIYEKFLNENSSKNDNHRLINSTLDIFSNYSSSSHAIPNIIFDIKLYNPSKIKVFNSNQYYSGLSYYKSYQDLRKNKIFGLDLASKEVRLHDPFFNYHIIKNFYENDIMELDKFSEEPLIAGEIEFAKRLDFYFKSFTF